MNTILIESIRKKRGFTQAQLAKKLNFSTTGYQKMIERGDIRISDLLNLCRLLNIEMGLILDKENRHIKSVDEIPVVRETQTMHSGRTTECEKELLACYKTISILQEKLLAYSDTKKPVKAVKKK
jgi:transcriptional regulator with XRE-family HTH domain